MGQRCCTMLLVLLGVACKPLTLEGEINAGPAWVIQDDWIGWWANGFGSSYWSTESFAVPLQ